VKHVFYAADNNHKENIEMQEIRFVFVPTSVAVRAHTRTTHIPFHRLGSKRMPLLSERLRECAEFWEKEENRKSHWAASWGNAKALAFVKEVTGVLPDAPMILGKDLVAMAIDQQHGRNSGSFDVLLPMALKRKKLVRALMQKEAPDYSFLKDEEFPRRSSVSLGVQWKSPSSQGMPVVRISGPRFRQESKLKQEIQVFVSTPTFLKEQGREPQVLSKDSSLLRPGLLLEVVARGNDGVAERQLLKWTREQQHVSFYVSANFTFIEVWFGPVLLFKRDITIIDEGERKSFEDLNEVWNEESQMFRKVRLLYDDHDSELQQAIITAGAELCGCVELIHILAQPDHEDFRTHFCIQRETAASESLQVCLSAESLSSNAIVRKGLEALADMLGSKAVSLPKISCIYWKHPRPDFEGHAVFSRLLRSIYGSPVFYNSWLLMVPRALIASSLTPGVSQTKTAADMPISAGMQVAFQDFKDGPWQRGRVIDTIGDAKVLVVAEHGDVPTEVMISQVRPIRHDEVLSSERTGSFHNSDQHRRKLTIAMVKPGDFVFAKTADRSYKHGMVVYVNKNFGTVDIAFDDGDACAGIEIRFIRCSGENSHNKQGENTFSARRTSEFRSENSGKFVHGQKVHILRGHDCMRMTGRIREAVDYGLRYDVLLSNGELVHKVPVQNILACSEVSSRKNERSEHSYVDAMCDRYRQILRKAATSLSDGRALRIQFQALDRSGTGRLRPSDFHAALNVLGFEPSEAEILEFIDKFREDGDGYVEYKDFVKFAMPTGVIKHSKSSLRHPLKWYRRFLENSDILRVMKASLQNEIGLLWRELVALDVSNMGHVSEKEFLQGLMRIGVTLSPNQRAQVMQTFSANQDVNYREFICVVEMALTDEILARTDKESNRQQQEKAISTLSPKMRQLRLENQAATRIQSIARMRMAMRSAGVRSSANSRMRIDRSWIANFAEHNEEGKEEDKNIERECGKWRQLLKLNTDNGAEITGVFRSMDTDCDGTISMEELAVALERYKISGRHVAQIFREMDSDNDGNIDMLDFRQFVLGQGRHEYKRDRSEDSLQGTQLMLLHLGMKVCTKLRQYFKVLHRCGANLYDLLVFRPRGVTICSVLRKQGFTLDAADWKRLEIFLANLVNQRGDRILCEDLNLLLSMSEENFRNLESESSNQHLSAYLEKPQDDLTVAGLSQLCHRIVHAIQMILRDRGGNKHRILWWLIGVGTESAQNKISVDRIDIERCLRQLKVASTSFEITELLSATGISEHESPCIDANRIARVLGFSRTLQQRLEKDYIHSRFKRNFVAMQRSKLGIKRLLFAKDYRTKGSQKLSEIIRVEILGEACFKKLRATVAAIEARGFAVCCGESLGERFHARLGCLSREDFERMLTELRFDFTNAEIHQLASLIKTEGETKEIDLFEFADLLEVVRNSVLKAKSMTKDWSTGFSGGTEVRELKQKLVEFNSGGLHLCQQDVEDACIRIHDPGVLGARNVQSILNAVGFSQCLTEFEILSLSRHTRSQLRAFLSNVVKSRNERLELRKAASYSSCHSAMSNMVRIGTQVVFKGRPFHVAKHEAGGKYSLRNGTEIISGISRFELTVGGGLSQFVNGMEVENRKTKQRGRITKVHADWHHVDTSFKAGVPTAFLKTFNHVNTTQLRKGMKVLALSSRDNKFFAAVVELVNMQKGTVNVRFDHGETESSLDSSRIRWK